ncbi:MAG: elongation factor 4, partial [Chloroflexota bacterium]
VEAFGFRDDEVLRVSGKTGEGVPEVMEALVTRVKPPRGKRDAPTRALIFDSKYDSYKGVIAYVRVVDGRLEHNQRVRMMGTGATGEILELGYFGPGLKKLNALETGEVGYVATGLKDVASCRVGDTITVAANPASEQLPGYQPIKSMVYTGLYPADGESYPELRDALDRLRLNDAALSYEPESSAALGFGFRCGFLGLLHMDVTQERLEREYGLSLIATAPSVSYEVTLNNGETIMVDNPSNLPEMQEIKEIREPWVFMSIVVPSRHIGAVMDLVNGRRGQFMRMEYLQAAVSDGNGGDGASPGQDSAANDARVLLEYKMPLAELLIDFYDQLKSRTQGYASLDYSIADPQPGDLVKLDILVNQQPVDALSMIVHRSNAQYQGRALAQKLKDLIPRQMFEVPIQAAIGNRVVARETVKAMRKNVLAKCYGGDVTRKRKLLEQQAEGKKRMKKIGKVEVPQEAFMAVLQLERQGA